MQDNYVEIEDIPVMRVKADWKGKGPSAAFDLLESKLPTLRGRRFYGTFRFLPEGGEEYYACVAMEETDDSRKFDLETGVIPSGWYIRRKVMNWEQVLRNGQLRSIIRDLVKGEDVDNDRPTIEFYRSHVELYLLAPVNHNPL
jgi:hypothetical protein